MGISLERNLLKTLSVTFYCGLGGVLLYVGFVISFQEDHPTQCIIHTGGGAQEKEEKLADWILTLDLSHL